MVVEVGELPNGWPLGLESMSVRVLGMVANVQVAAAELHSSQIRSTSFSSFTSSDLDTESTKSFYHDRSVSLGRLFKIRPISDRDGFYLMDSTPISEHQQVNLCRASSSNAMKRHKMAVNQHGICIPLLKTVLVKMSPSRNCSRQ